VNNDNQALVLTNEQELQADIIYGQLKTVGDAKMREIARLLASKDDHQIFGDTEFEIRDLVHQLGAESLATATEAKKRVLGC
jgi:hypothetical protein